jgi:hypothetical protein
MCLNKSLEAEMVSPRWYIVLLTVPLLSAIVFAQSSNPPARPLTAEQRDYVVRVLKIWLRRQMGEDPQNP